MCVFVDAGYAALQNFGSWNEWAGAELLESLGSFTVAFEFCFECLKDTCNFYSAWLTESTGISVCYLLRVSWSLAQLKCYQQGLCGKASPAGKSECICLWLARTGWLSCQEHFSLDSVLLQSLRACFAFAFWLTSKTVKIGRVLSWFKLKFSNISISQSSKFSILRRENFFLKWLMLCSHVWCQSPPSI